MDISKASLDAFLADKDLRNEFILKWRDEVDSRERWEKLYIWEEYRKRSFNYDNLKLDIKALESFFDVTDEDEALGMDIRRYAIAKNGDAVMEFRAGSQIYQFRTSSEVLAQTSSLFSYILSPPQSGVNPPLDIINEMPRSPVSHICEDGMEVKLYRMPQVEYNKDGALSTLLYAAHMQNSKVPEEIEYPVFVSIAEVCLRYRCSSPLELRVKYEWLPQWVHMILQDNVDAMVLISYTFRLRDLFIRTSKPANLNATDEAEIQAKEPWPQPVRDIISDVRRVKLAEIHDTCTSAIEEYLRPPLDNTDRKANIGSLQLTSVPRCPKGSHHCDALKLGWLMLVYNELQLLPHVFNNTQRLKSSSRSIRQLCDGLRQIPSPPQVHPGSCDQIPAFRNAIIAIYNSITGVSLSKGKAEVDVDIRKRYPSCQLLPVTLRYLPQIVTKYCWMKTFDMVVKRLKTSKCRLRDLYPHLQSELRK